MIKKLLLLLLLIIGLSGCFSTPKIRANNICQVLNEHIDWYQGLAQTQRFKGVDKSLILAFIHQESRFKSNAKPPRDTFFGLARSSSAYGFAQVKDETWDWYKSKNARPSAKRNNFADASDFIGWYVTVSSKLLRISKNDVAKQYLAYHEGQGGYRQKTFNKKPWLVRVSKKVANRANKYKRQLRLCENDLIGRKKGWSLF